MRPTTLSSEEIAARGQRIYEERVRSEVEGAHHGEFVVIDIDSGDYEVDSKDIDASIRLRERHPGAVTFGLRVGFPAAYRLGGRFQVR
jgi:hypothetical protein